MYNLIIIDDEYTVALELSDFLDYSEYGFEVTGVFSEPRDALEFIENNKVDLILTDIKMVGVTGLDILKAVNESYPQTLVVLISAYRDFSYAKDAITHNAFEYLTKPILYKKSVIAPHFRRWRCDEAAFLVTQLRTKK